MRSNERNISVQTLVIEDVRMGRGIFKVLYRESRKLRLTSCQEVYLTPYMLCDTFWRARNPRRIGNMATLWNCSNAEHVPKYFGNLPQGNSNLVQCTLPQSYLQILSAAKLYCSMFIQLAFHNKVTWTFIFVRPCFQLSDKFWVFVNLRIAVNLTVKTKHAF